MKKYTISHLLSKQPKSIQKHPYYAEMLHHYRTSPSLKKVRFNRRCYSLLLHGKIAPENLKHFYRTYRLPKDPFFPLFFAIKREYLEQKKERKRKKTKYIADRMRQLPLSILNYIKFLAVLERYYNYGNHYPVWSARLFPKTKKQVNQYPSYTFKDWRAFFSAYLTILSRRYRALSSVDAEKLLACFLLEWLPECPLKSYPAKDEVVKRYRRLSKLHHPDRGGDPEMFVSIKWAKDILTGK